MFRWLKSFSRSPEPQVAPSSVPDGYAVYAIGDIHGRLDLQEVLERMIAADAEQLAATHRVVLYLGDYIDRGMDSRGVVERLLSQPLPGFEVFHMKGNHEQALLDFLENPLSGAAWMEFGGGPTLLSYGVRPPMAGSSPDALHKAQQELAQKLPEDHLAFFQGLRMITAIGSYAFVHAGIQPGRVLAQQEHADLLWIREPFLSSKKTHDRVVVHGHTVTEHPVLRANRIGIDTGAYASGQLTAVALHGQNVRFLSTKP